MESSTAALYTTLTEKQKEKRRRDHLNRLNIRVKHLEKALSNAVTSLDTCREDRDRYRNIFHTRMLWWVDLMESRQYPSLPHMVKEDMKLLTQCEKANL